MPLVILDPASWSQLEQVQHRLNEEVRYVAPPRFTDFWEPARKTGDCKQIALAKRERLMEMGWPPEALRMATVVDEKDELHAVLTVDVTMMNGLRGTYVLDNRFTEVQPWQELTHIGYSWLQRAVPGQVAWTYIGQMLHSAQALLTVKTPADTATV